MTQQQAQPQERRDERGNEAQSEFEDDESRQNADQEQPDNPIQLGQARPADEQGQDEQVPSENEARQQDSRVNGQQ